MPNLVKYALFLAADVAIIGCGQAREQDRWKYRIHLDDAAGSGNKLLPIGAAYLNKSLSFRGRMAERFKAAVLKFVRHRPGGLLQIP